MTKEEINEKIMELKFSEGRLCNSNDKIKDLIEEIYYAGVWRGCRHAVDILDCHCRTAPLDDKYLNSIMDKIIESFKLCKMYEECEE